MSKCSEEVNEIKKLLDNVSGIMEVSKLNVIWSKSGSGSPTAKISIPVSWLYKMGISANDRLVEVKFWDLEGQERISIEKFVAK